MLRQLRDACPGAKIIVLTNTLRPRSLAQALDVGVDGYLLKNISLEGLTQSLSLVMLGEKVFPTQLAGLLAEATARSRAPDLPSRRRGRAACPSARRRSCAASSTAIPTR